MSWFTERRLDFIDWCLEHHDELRRSDLMKVFGISMPQASADIQEFIRLYPGALRYDKSIKRYVPAKKTYKARRGAPNGFTWPWPIQ